MKTYFAKNEERAPKWYVIDASGKILGRMASQIAKILRGKHKPEYTPHIDMGDYVIVINASKVAVTGNKAEDKMYYRHSGFPGGIKERTFTEQLEKNSAELIEIAVKGMLPKNPLGRAMLAKLKVYKDDNHPHVAQQPENLNLEESVG